MGCERTCCVLLQLFELAFVALFFSVPYGAAVFIFDDENEPRDLKGFGLVGFSLCGGLIALGSWICFQTLVTELILAWAVVAILCPPVHPIALLLKVGDELADDD